METTKNDIRDGESRGLKELSLYVSTRAALGHGDRYGS